MNVEFRDIVSLGSLVVSGFALLFSAQAKQEAQDLDELVFRAETVNRLLKEVHESTTKAANDDDRTASCLYAGALAIAEQDVVPDEGRRLVGKLFNDQVQRGLLPHNCVVGTLEILEVATEVAVPENPQKQVSTSEGSFDIGQFHALIASYPAEQAQCGFAIEDVEEFAQLLEGRGLEGSRVYVARTVKSNSYAVTVDAGDNRALAHEMRSAIQAVSSRSADGRTGHDSFVQINTDWYIDPDCNAIATINA